MLVEDGNHGEYRPRSDEFCEEGVAFIRAADLKDGVVDFLSADKINQTAVQRIRKGIGQPGDILISHKGTVGKVARAPRNAPAFVCSPQTTFWRSLDQTRLDADYLYVLMRSPLFRYLFSVRAGETDMAGYVSLTSQRQINIPVPSISEQLQISAAIKPLDDKIELNRRMNETLEATAQAIFRDWFVDFGPVRRKAAGETDPVAVLGGVETDPSKAEELAALFPAQLGNELIPVGWSERPLNEIAVQHTKSLKPADFASEEVEHFSLPAYDAGRSPAVEPGGGIKSNKSIVPNGAVLLSKLNPEIDRVWLPEPQRDLKQLCSTEFLVFTPHEGFSTAYLYALFRSERFRSMLTGMVTGTSKSHQRVSPKALKDRLVLAPPPDVLGAFEALTAPLLNKALVLRAENRALATTRDALLPKLISGELRLTDEAA